MSLFRAAIMGPPACGKGTISDKIINKYNVTHISAGDLLRKHISMKTELGSLVRKYVEAGMLVPDKFILQVMFSKFEEISHRNWVSDGFPRTVVQAEKLLRAYPLNMVINLQVPEEVLLERVKGRLVHIPSGRVYHTKFKPPRKKGFDDETGEPLSQREDDKPDAMVRRLKIYEDITAPLLNFYNEKGILKNFDGTDSNHLWKSIDLTLSKFLHPRKGGTHLTMSSAVL